MDRWVGKVAVVTGASVGIGAAIVVDLISAGLIVVGLARRKELVERIPIEGTGKLYAVQCDVSDDASVAEAFNWISAEIGAIHVLVNNAGIGIDGKIIDEDNDEGLKRVLQTNLWGVVMCTKKAVNIMKREKVIGAHIININSVVGYSVAQPTTAGRPCWNIYPASKFGVTALSEVLRQEFNCENFKFRVTVRTDICWLTFAQN